ncbi:hypothetical protein D3C86_1231070 [compost metagenome]
MLDFSTIAIEPELAQEGVWVPFMGAEFKVARPGPAYQARLVELAKEHWDLINSKTDEGNAKAVEITRKAYAELVLRDWRNVGDKGVEMAYSTDLAFALLCDPRQQEFHDFLDRVVNNRSNYQTKVDAEIAESVKSSAVS